jgi:hypothetical protein
MDFTGYRYSCCLFLDSLKKVIKQLASGSLGVCIAYGVSRCAGAYLSLSAIAHISRHDISILAACYSGLWWLSIVTAGAARTALIARALADPLNSEWYDNQARMLWHFYTLLACIGVGCAALLGYGTIFLSGALLWCYVGSLWSDWVLAVSARAQNTVLQVRLFYGGALFQLMMVNWCISSCGFIGALYAQGAFYWGSLVAHGQYQSCIPRRCSLRDLARTVYASFSYMPPLLSSWMTASATRLVLMSLYGAPAVASWISVEFIISPIITALSALFSLIYLPRLLRGDFGAYYPAEHPLGFIALGCAGAAIVYSVGGSNEVLCALLYTSVVAASMAMAFWSYRAQAAFPERAVPALFALSQTAMAAFLWAWGGVVPVLVGQILVLMLGMGIYGFFIGARLYGSSIYSVLWRRALWFCPRC